VASYFSGFAVTLDDVLLKVVASEIFKAAEHCKHLGQVYGDGPAHDEAESAVQVQIFSLELGNV